MSFFEWIKSLFSKKEEKDYTDLNHVAGDLIGASPSTNLGITFDKVFAHKMTEAVKHYEGLYLKPYLCPAGVWTIGYGHTKGISNKTKPITEELANQYLYDDLKYAYNAVIRLWPQALSKGTINQIAALTSFTFNLGEGNLSSSTLLKCLKSDNIGQCYSEILRWDKATVNGVKQSLPGLTKRRKTEADCFAYDVVVY